MYDELTRGDVQKMQEEIDYRTQVLRPKLIEDVQTARAFGDLSENFEYKCAKQEKNRNDSRIRYLQRMIKTALLHGEVAALRPEDIVRQIALLSDDQLLRGLPLQHLRYRAGGPCIAAGDIAITEIGQNVLLTLRCEHHNEVADLLKLRDTLGLCDEIGRAHV